MLQTRRPVTIEDFDVVGGAVAALMRELGIRAGVGGPIVLAGEVWGALNVTWPAGAQRSTLLDQTDELQTATDADLASTVFHVRSSFGTVQSSLTAPSIEDRTSPSQPFTKTVGSSPSPRDPFGRPH